MTDKYFTTVMFANMTIAELAKDGLIYLFDPEDIRSFLDAAHPSDALGWFFNKSRDRYCAEWSGEKISVNPAIVSHIFGMPVLREE